MTVFNLNTSSPLFKYLLGGLWLAFLAAGAGGLAWYSSKPGAAAIPQIRWPGGQVPRRPDRDQLVVFLHPHCPCSNATVGELERLMAAAPNRFETEIVFLKPRSRSDAWVRDALWRKARALPGAKVWIDEDGVEAARFQARTSGQVFLYDRRGRLAFEGGITPGRGHMGDGAGRAAILAALRSPPAEEGLRLASVPVFGCSLLDPDHVHAGGHAHAVHAR